MMGGRGMWLEALIGQDVGHGLLHCPDCLGICRDVLRIATSLPSSFAQGHLFDQKWNGYRQTPSEFYCLFVLLP